MPPEVGPPPRISGENAGHEFQRPPRVFPHGHANGLGLRTIFEPGHFFVELQENGLGTQPTWPDEARLHIDFGQVSEDAMWTPNCPPNDKLDTESPIGGAQFWSASVNDPAHPLLRGAPSSLYGDREWFSEVAFGSDGTAWAGFHCVRTDLCPGNRVGMVGRLANPAPVRSGAGARGCSRGSSPSRRK